MRSLLALGAAALLSASAMAFAHAAAPGKLRVLIVTGGHDFEREPFFAMFDAIPAIEWREVKHPDANAWFAPEKRREYDVVVLYDMPSAITEQEKTWLAETVRLGNGVVALHHTLAGYPQWPEYAKIVGGRYLLSNESIDATDWKASTFRDDVPHDVAVADKKHPITRGMADFHIVDELYRGYWVSPGVHSLLEVDHPESSKIVGWTNAYGKARVVYLQLGHGHVAYQDVNYRRLVERSILWVARKLR